MGILTKYHLPMVSATKGNVPPGATIAATTGAYGTAINTPATKWILGSDIPKCRKFLVCLTTGAIANAPTAIKVSLFGGGTNTSGQSAAEIASSVNEVATPPGNTVYCYEIDPALISDLTKYYSLGVTVNGAGASSTCYADAVWYQLDPYFT